MVGSPCVVGTPELPRCAVVQVKPGLHWCPQDVLELWESAREGVEIVMLQSAEL